MDAIGGEGIGERAHHRLLADQVVEAGGAVFAREHAIAGAGGGARARGRARAKVRRRRGCGAITSFMRERARRPGAAGQRGPSAPGAAVGGWTKTRPGSLGLLPSGPDPVGERYVLRQPPGPYLDHADGWRKGARQPPQPSSGKAAPTSSPHPARVREIPDVEALPGRASRPGPRSRAAYGRPRSPLKRSARDRSG